MVVAEIQKYRSAEDLSLLGHSDYLLAEARFPRLGAWCAAQEAGSVDFVEMAPQELEETGCFLARMWSGARILSVGCNKSARRWTWYRESAE